jgi:phosphonate transport system ATP-binding protein
LSVTLAVAQTGARATRVAVPAPVELAVRGLRVGFGAAAPVLNDVSLSIRHGESVALVGANGAGKSTLLRACLRLIEPQQGSVRLFDEEIMGLEPSRLRALRARIGFVFQRHNLVPRLSVLSNVLHGALAAHGGPRCWSHALAPRALRERALHCLDLVGLADFATRRADRLSGGQSQRVAIARALMAQPRLVIADEPVASLDPRAGEEVMDLFVRLMGEERTTLVFSSHHLDHALRYAARVVGLRAGCVTLDESSRALNPHTLRELYG